MPNAGPKDKVHDRRILSILFFEFIFYALPPKALH